MLDKFRYFILRAMRNMRQWPFLCFASVLTMAVALTVVATFYLTVMNIQQMATKWSEDLQVVAYLDKNPSTAQLSSLLSTIKNYPEVSEVLYVSPKEAMNRFRLRLGTDADILDGVKQNILPASLEINLISSHRNRTGIDQVISLLKKNRDIGDIRYGEDWLERFESFVYLLQIVSLVLGGFLLLAALFIVSNTIKLTLYARRDELEIMSLVGATRSFIKLPFLLEGALQGFFGGLLSLGFLSIVFNFFLAQIFKSFWLSPAGIELLFLDVNQQSILVIAGIFLGMIGSLASLRKLVQF